MEKSILKDLYEALKNPSIPGNRILRKVTGLTFLIIISLVIYRHYYLSLNDVKSLISTLMYTFFTVLIVWFLGGVATSALYTSFLEAIGAKKTHLTPSIFIVEWIICLWSPVAGVIFAGLFLNMENYAI